MIRIEIGDDQHHVEVSTGARESWQGHTPVVVRQLAEQAIAMWWARPEQHPSVGEGEQ